LHGIRSIAGSESELGLIIHSIHFHAANVVCRSESDD
jgi:hypothetical protein